MTRNLSFAATSTVALLLSPLISGLGSVTASRALQSVGEPEVQLTISASANQQTLLIWAHTLSPVTSYVLSWCFKPSPWLPPGGLTPAEEIELFEFSPSSGSSVPNGVALSLTKLSYEALDSTDANDMSVDDKYEGGICFALTASASAASGAIPPSPSDDPVLLSVISIEPKSGGYSFPISDIGACLSNPQMPYSPVATTGFSGRRLQRHPVGDGSASTRHLLYEVVDPQVVFLGAEGEALSVAVAAPFGCVNLFSPDEMPSMDCDLQEHSGDINGDLVMDIIDVVAMIMTLLGNEVELPKPFDGCTGLAADGNEDGIFDILDAVGFLAILLGSACPVNFNSVPCECGNSGPNFDGSPCA